MKTLRDGRAEMLKADEILTHELPGAPPVPSPGRALLINTLFELGRRGAQLDWQEYETRWLERRTRMFVRM